MTGGRIESELKYWAESDAPLEALAKAPALGPTTLGPARSVEESDRYLDTADLHLSATGWACRIRERDGRTIISLKGRAEHATGDALHRRSEVEGPAGPGVEAAAWPPSPARDLLIEMAGAGPLLERFTLAQHRIERSVTWGRVVVGLLSLDRARVLHHGVELGLLRVVELEFEKKAITAGLDPGPMAAALGDLPGLVPDSLTKLERALAMVAAAQ
ncbi:MAG: CYTH domain-containing protein [Chloroflexota bacterium]